MKKLIRLALSVMCAVGLSGLSIAGSLDSPGAPSAGSGMYSLQNLYDYLTSGTALSVQSGFQEPALAPGSTMKTTKEIGDALKALFEQSEIADADVAQGKKFICTQPGSWGIQTGTAQLVPTPTATPTQTETPTQTPTATAIPWDSSACTARGGYWAPDGLGGSGCWVAANHNESCTNACSRYSLTCDTRSWKDVSCNNVLPHFYGRSCQDCWDQDWQGAPMFGYDAYVSKYSCVSGTNRTQDCDELNWVNGNWQDARRVCVCTP
ncbi:MAG: hypothetical protein NTZ78_01185 [Candidatus Aureabacteria bacterium]|nr:hypothetical protein [Candidatus Auribacterota bacterium]